MKVPSFCNSPLHIVTLPFFGTIGIKRDDLLTLDGFSNISGNKARKLLYYISQPNSFWNKKVLLSYGGTQSNAMNAICNLSKTKNVPFIYFTSCTKDSLPKVSLGSWTNCLSKQMIFCSLAKPKYERIMNESYSNQTLQEFCEKMDLSTDLFYYKDNETSASSIINTLLDYDIEFIKQGGANDKSELGLSYLGKELVEQTIRTIENKNKYVIILPAGTGTTALYLGKYIANSNSNIEKIVPIPCIGGSRVLRNQMEKLDPLFMKNNTIFHFLEEGGYCKHPFAFCNKKDFEMWQLLCSFELDIDLIYAPRTFRALKKSFDSITRNGSLFPIYLHTGGTEGNISQVEKYNQHLFKK